MKILMIGGTGNISYPASQALVARGEDVILYNRGNHPMAGARQVIGDRYDNAAFEQDMAALLAKEGHIDVVIDMICFHPEHGRAVQRALGGKIGQYIFCSTVDVYTKTKSGYPIREDFEREPNPAFEYAYHKAILEKELEAAARQGHPDGRRMAASMRDLKLPPGYVEAGLAENEIRCGVSGGTAIGTSCWKDSKPLW